MFGGFHDDCVSSEEGADYGPDEVVEGVVPGNGGGHDAEGFVDDAVLFVHHEEVRWAARWEEGLFAVVKGPF